MLSQMFIHCQSLILNSVLRVFIFVHESNIKLVSVDYFIVNNRRIQTWQHTPIINDIINVNEMKVNFFDYLYKVINYNINLNSFKVGCSIFVFRVVNYLPTSINLNNIQS